MFDLQKPKVFSIEKWRDEQGATAVEYGLLVGLIAVFLITAMSTLGNSISNKFRETACKTTGGVWTAATTADPDGACSKDLPTP